MTGLRGLHAFIPPFITFGALLRHRRQPTEQSLVAVCIACGHVQCIAHMCGRVYWFQNVSDVGSISTMYGGINQAWGLSAIKTALLKFNSANVIKSCIELISSWTEQFHKFTRNIDFPVSHSMHDVFAHYG